MKTVVINTNEKDIIIAIGKVKHVGIAHSFDVPVNALPVDLGEAFGEYSYKNGKFIKSLTADPTQEREWQRAMLNKVNSSILEYQADMAIREPYSELRISTCSEGEYYELLGDRKLLIEYVRQQDFPECGRPALSVLA